MADKDNLRDLFEDELRDIYDAEKQIVKALPKIARVVSNEELKGDLLTHLEETRGHVARLDRAFDSLHLRPKGRHCAGMAGILDEGSDLIGRDGNATVLDAAFIAACQRVEHYEIGAYGCLIAWGTLLGYTQAVGLLAQNEKEEKAANDLLTDIAETAINPDAAAAESMDEEARERVAVKRARRQQRATR